MLKYVKLRARTTVVGSVKPKDITDKLRCSDRKKPWVLSYRYSMRPMPQKDAQTIINKLKARARACNEVLKCP